MSGGEQQMLAVGRGMMLKPRLLMLDEPSLGLAPVMCDVTFEKIAEGSPKEIVENPEVIRAYLGSGYAQAPAGAGS